MSSKIRRLELERDLAKANKRIDDLASCNSYKIGRAVTSIPRAFRRAVNNTVSHRIGNAPLQSTSAASSNLESSQNESAITDVSTLPSLLKEWHDENSGDTLVLENPVTYSQKT